MSHIVLILFIGRLFNCFLNLFTEITARFATTHLGKTEYVIIVIKKTKHLIRNNEFFFTWDIRAFIYFSLGWSEEQALSKSRTYLEIVRLTIWDNIVGHRRRHMVVWSALYCIYFFRSSNLEEIITAIIISNNFILIKLAPLCSSTGCLNFITSFNLKLERFSLAVKIANWRYVQFLHQTLGRHVIDEWIWDICLISVHHRDWYLLWWITVRMVLFLHRTAASTVLNVVHILSLHWIYLELRSISRVVELVLVLEHLLLML